MKDDAYVSSSSPGGGAGGSKSAVSDCILFGDCGSLTVRSLLECNARTESLRKFRFVELVRVT